MILANAIAAVASGDYSRLEYDCVNPGFIQFYMPLRESKASIQVCIVEIDAESVAIHRHGSRNTTKWSINDPKLCNHLKDWMRENVSDFIDFAETLW